MAEIELVIKIDKAYYDTIKDMVDVGLGTGDTAIANGIPLPKGRGRLIDEKILLRKLRSRNFGFNLPTWIKVAIDNTPTTIEADKAESEEKG